MMKKLFAISLFASAIAVGHAAVLDFEDLGFSIYDQTILSGGFSFTFAASGWGVLQNDYTGYNRVLNGTTTASWSGDRNGETGRLTFKPVDDSGFNLGGFDAAIFHAPFASTTIRVEGFYEAGGSVFEDHAIDGTWSGVSLGSGFSGLDRVVISDLTSGSFDGIAGVQVDNLDISPVPEPGTIIALAMGALAAARRRRA